MPKSAVVRKMPEPPPPAPAKHLEFELMPAPEANQAISLRTQAVALIVTNREEHVTCLEFVRNAKQLKRKIEDHWSGITRRVDDLKRSLLDLKRRDLEPVEMAITAAEGTALTYETTERRRVAAEQDRLRREAEFKAQQDRERDLAEQERKALEAEQGSPLLSAREQVFVESIVNGMTQTQAASRAGYKNVIESGTRLMGTQKIADAIQAKRTAREIRQQAEARKAEPLNVVTEKVQSNVGRVAGVSSRVYKSAEVFDAQALKDAFKAGALPSDEALDPNQTYLNEQAKSLGKKLEQVYPGVRYVERHGIAG